MHMHKLFFLIISAIALECCIGEELKRKMPIEVVHDIHGEGNGLSLTAQLCLSGTESELSKTCGVAVSFADESGGHLRCEGEGLSVSRKYGEYMYIRLRPGENSYSHVFKIPQGATSCVLQFFRFDLGGGRIDIRDIKTDETHLGEKNVFPRGISFDENRLSAWRSEFIRDRNSIIRIFSEPIISLSYAPSNVCNKCTRDMMDACEYLSYPIAMPFDWSCSNIAHRTFAYRMNGLIHLDKPYLAWLYCGKSEVYRDYILAWIKDWVVAHPVVDRKVPGFAWHDDATARRVFRMSFYLYLFREWIDDETYSRCKDSLRDQADLLATDAFYTHNHNHGMYQDMGLIAYAVLVEDDIRRTSRYLHLAYSRALSYFNIIFTAEGIHKEHSPDYHVMINSDMMYFSDVARNLDLNLSETLVAHARHAAEFAVSLMLPDKTLPSIGDSTRKPLKSTRWEGIPCYDTVTQGNVTNYPPDDVVYPKSGYAIFRSSWTNKIGDATYIFFTAAYHNQNHKHSDDLSFLLYHRGDLFVEAGNRNYQYKEKQTSYAYSGFGHNVVIVDGADFPVSIGPSGWRSASKEAFKSYMSDYFVSSNYCRAVGVQGRFKNVVQTRRVEYWREEGRVRIADETVSKNDSKLEYIYHIAPGVDVEEIGGGWSLSRKGRLVATVLARGDVESIETYRDDSKFPYCTYVFEGKADARVGSLLKVNVQAKKGRKMKSSLDLYLW